LSEDTCPKKVWTGGDESRGGCGEGVCTWGKPCGKLASCSVTGATRVAGAALSVSSSSVVASWSSSLECALGLSGQGQGARARSLRRDLTPPVPVIRVWAAPLRVRALAGEKTVNESVVGVVKASGLAKGGAGTGNGNGKGREIGGGRDGRAETGDGERDGCHGRLYSARATSRGICQTRLMQRRICACAQSQKLIGL
jgi:hypothetical protein